MLTPSSQLRISWSMRDSGVVTRNLSSVIFTHANDLHSTYVMRTALQITFEKADTTVQIPALSLGTTRSAQEVSVADFDLDSNEAGSGITCPRCSNRNSQCPQCDTVTHFLEEGKEPFVVFSIQANDSTIDNGVLVSVSGLENEGS